MTSAIALDQLIAITPGICGGKPRIANRRIAVQDIAIWHERLGLSADQIAAEFSLSLAEVYAALAYYFAHRDEVERSIQEGQTLTEVIANGLKYALTQLDKVNLDDFDAEIKRLGG